MKTALMILMTIMITTTFLKNFQFPLSSISSGCVECTEVSYCFNFSGTEFYSKFGVNESQGVSTYFSFTTFLVTCSKTRESNFA